MFAIGPADAHGNAQLLMSGLRDVLGGRVYGALAAAVLAEVFAWSSLAKLRDPGAAGRAIHNFGLGRRPGAWPGIALGAVELLLAAALAAGTLRPALAPMALSAATALLLTFAFLVGRSLWARRAFPCACFGAGSRPLSALTLARIVLLAVVGVSALLGRLLAHPAARLDGQEALLSFVAAAALIAIAVLAAALPSMARFRDPLLIERLRPGAEEVR